MTSANGDGDVSIDYSNATGMLSMSFSPNGRMNWASIVRHRRKHGSVQLEPIVYQVLDRVLRDAEAAAPSQSESKAASRIDPEAT